MSTTHDLKDIDIHGPTSLEAVVVKAGEAIGKNLGDVLKYVEVLRRTYGTREELQVAILRHSFWDRRGIPCRLKMSIKGQLMLPGKNGVAVSATPGTPATLLAAANQADRHAPGQVSVETRNIPDGWETLWSTHYNCPYYFHRSTRVYQWEVPSDTGSNSNTSSESFPLSHSTNNASPVTSSDSSEHADTLVQGDPCENGNGDDVVSPTVVTSPDSDPAASNSNMKDDKSTTDDLKNTALARAAAAALERVPKHLLGSPESSPSTSQSIGSWTSLRLGEGFSEVAARDSTKQRAQGRRAGDEVRLRGLLVCRSGGARAWSTILELPLGLRPPRALFFTLDPLELDQKRRANSTRSPSARSPKAGFPVPAGVQICIDPSISISGSGGNSGVGAVITLLHPLPPGLVFSLDGVRWASEWGMVVDGGGASSRPDPRQAWRDLPLAFGFTTPPTLQLQSPQFCVRGDMVRLRGRVVCSQPCQPGMEVTEPLPGDVCPVHDVLKGTAGFGGPHVEATSGGGGGVRLVALASSAALQLRDPVEAGEYFSLEGFQWSLADHDSGWLPLPLLAPFVAPHAEWPVQPAQYRITRARGGSGPSAAAADLACVLQLRGVVVVGGGGGGGGGRWAGWWCDWGEF